MRIRRFTPLVCLGLSFAIVLGVSGTAFASMSSTSTSGTGGGTRIAKAAAESQDLGNRLQALAVRLDAINAQINSAHQRVEDASAAFEPESAALATLGSDVDLASRAQLAAQAQVSDRAGATAPDANGSDGYLFDLASIGDLQARIVVAQAVAAGGNVESTLGDWTQQANAAYDVEMDRYRADLWQLNDATQEREALIRKRHDLVRTIAGIQAREDRLIKTLATTPVTQPSGVPVGAVHSSGTASTYRDWATALTGQLHAPACPDNIVVIVAWEASEGTDAAWNPLATTLTMRGSTSFNSAGVQNYPTPDAGLAATERTLSRGASSYDYGAIIADMRACAPASTTAAAINASQWCRGCAFGAYVTGLLPEVAAHFSQFASRAIGT